ncbi:PhoH family protein [Deferribacterales bacterium Es71-Z0220]|uniref:PhoH family protein n=1 Tax=Deferrivibrio essentukiensis TaxID=2880922 RepID=UPI001F614947|nr:PhoH family protein [Deferrivibrio essentukiensis]MCB4204274.1 PhoH family protein [Deferrivibrio essentukiensis]
MQTTKVFVIEEALVPAILGHKDKYLKYIQKSLDISVAVRGNEFNLSGDKGQVEKGLALFNNLREIVLKSNLSMSDLESAVRMVIEDTKTHISEVLTDIVKVSGRVKSVVPKTPRQKTYVQFIKDYDVVFGIGPAGTGKTYLAVAMAVNMFLNKKVSRIILTRPAVEAGERLGFLPGDIADKINPYLRPLYDALYNMMDFEKVGSLIEKGVIELAPLAFMRGRTLNDAFIILDEAQNTTVEQMKMFLTRLGFNSKAVITGDITQVDLPSDKKSGLIVVRDILKDVDGLKFVDFTKSDVIRHPLVQRIINAYEEYEAKKNGN